MSFEGFKDLKVVECDKCKNIKRVMMFGGVNLCESCFKDAKRVVREWAGVL